MRDYLSVDRDANAIRLRRSTFSGTFLLVEGSSDRIFYERFVDKVACASISISGKPSSKLRVIAVLSTLEKSNFQGVLADPLTLTATLSKSIQYHPLHHRNRSFRKANPSFRKLIMQQPFHWT
jgi:hypothetical protein